MKCKSIKVKYFNMTIGERFKEGNQLKIMNIFLCNESRYVNFFDVHTLSFSAISRLQHRAPLGVPFLIGSLQCSRWCCCAAILNGLPSVVLGTGLCHFLRGRSFFQAAVFEDLAVFQMDQAISLMGQFFIVGDDNKRSPMCLI